MTSTRLTRALATVLLFSGAPLATAADGPPNIIYIFADDHARRAISAYDATLVDTPNIDRIAREGMIFDASFCANSICGPSRASVLTGLHSHANGFAHNGNWFDGTQTTFPKLLQGAGYDTALIGKWHLGSTPTGFDHWQILPGQGNYVNPDFLTPDGLTPEGKVRHDGYVTDVITDHAIEWLDARLDTDEDTDRPFLLMCQHKAPHRNWMAAPRHYNLFDGDFIPEPASLFDDYAGRTTWLGQNEMSIDRHMSWAHDMKLPGENQDPETFGGHRNAEWARMTPAQRAEWDAAYADENEAFLAELAAGTMTERMRVKWIYQRYIKEYLRCIVAVDENVGRLLDWLDENDMAENTIVVYSSDQGFYLGEHGWYDKRWMFEESLFMPFVIRWPGVVAPGTRSSALIQNIDHGPTFLDAAGVAVPKTMHGNSLIPVLRAGGNAPADWRESIYYAYYMYPSVHHVPIHSGVRTDRHKLMWFPQTEEWQLFDLRRDPNELTSVHDAPAYRDVLSEMQARYEMMREQFNVDDGPIIADVLEQAR